MAVAVQPKYAVSTLAQLRFDTDRHRRQEAEAISAAPGGEDLPLVPAQQIDVPCDDAVESGVPIAASREIADKEDGDVERLFLCQSAQERRLVLDRMADQVRDAGHHSVIFTEQDSGLLAGVPRSAARWDRNGTACFESHIRLVGALRSCSD